MPPLRPQQDDGHARFWSVWRSYDDAGQPAAWCASKKAGAPAEWAPTLHARTLAELEQQMSAPPRAVRLGPSPEALAAHAAGMCS
ncbi:hypothetical protein [Streptomonospora litoralis]|uniref:Uncharacterized protein n=1 Tax=Streptomonospora litoralis TaxID=2498135 RepID=A0A4P6Q7Q3_9ACTN|nr:hypothetical protein [Streptomonospora litoralis]QBI56775.1 hypothetical protein EKD16_25170 [Streptomonospora litoralis]